MFQNSLQIEKELNHSYLYLHGGDWKEESHEQKIIQKCSIPGTLPFRLIQEEEENIFQYDFSSYERIVDYFAERKMSLSHILGLFESIHNALVHLEEYLLSPEILGLDTALIMYDAENNLFLFPLIPSKDETLEKEIKLLIDFVAEHLDERDEAAILSSYFLQQEKKKDLLQIKSILQILHIREERKQSGNKIEEHISLNTRDTVDLPSNSEYLGTHFPDTIEDSKNMEVSLPSSVSAEEWDLSSCSYSDYTERMKSIALTESEKRERTLSQSPESMNESCFSSQKDPSKPEKSSSPFSLKMLFQKKKKIENSGNNELKHENKEYSSKSPELIRTEKRKSKKEALKKFFLCLSLMLLLPLILYFWKGALLLQEHLPFLLLIEAAALLYGSLDILLFLFSRNSSEKNQNSL